MRRLIFYGVLGVMVAGVAFAAWRWWTAPPTTAARDLAEVCRWAPANADFVLIVAQPHRTARYLLRRPQAVVPLAIVAPDLIGAINRQQAILQASTASTTGALVVWSKGKALGLAVQVNAGARLALQTLCTNQSLAYSEEGGVVRMATDPDLLRGERCSTPPAEGRASALFRTPSTWWRIRATRTRLLARWGTPLIKLSNGPHNLLSTHDVSVFARALPWGLGGVHGPAQLVMGENEAWGLRLHQTTLGGLARAAIVGTQAPTAGEKMGEWNGLLGKLWGRTEPDVVVASSQDLASAMARDSSLGEEGYFRGSELAASLTKLSSRLGQLPGLATHTDRWREGLARLDGIRTARWRLEESGGLIEIAW